MRCAADPAKHWNHIARECQVVLCSTLQFQAWLAGFGQQITACMCCGGCTLCHELVGTLPCKLAIHEALLPIKWHRDPCRV